MILEFTVYDDYGQNIVAKAKGYAKEKHKAQRRKYTDEPYFVHCEEVAKLVETYSYLYGNDEEVIASALLHDVVEDTDATIEDIENLFGKRIARIVSEVTDVSKPTDGNRETRKEIDRKHLEEASPEGQTIKLADLIHNTQSIVAHDRNFAIVYLREKEKLLEILTKGDKELHKRACDSLMQSKLELME